MSTEPKYGGPAFPVYDETHMYPTSTGMTLRDWFAGQALATIYRSWDDSCLRNIGNPDPDVIKDVNECLDGIATDCYRIADAMIAAREKGGNNE